MALSRDFKLVKLNHKWYTFIVIITWCFDSAQGNCGLKGKKAHSKTDGIMTRDNASADLTK